MLQELVGKTKNQNLVDEAYQIYKESFVKEFPEYFEKNHSKMCSIVTALENNEIKNIGMSKLDDLLLDNYGYWFGALWNPQTLTPDAKWENGALSTIMGWSSAIGVKWNMNDPPLAVGSLIKVGTGLTPAQRSDYKLETNKQTLSSSDGAWNSGLGKIDIAGSITADFSDSISEVGLFGRWGEKNLGNVNSLLIAHDNISPVIPVIIGQTINVDYQLILN